MVKHSLLTCGWKVHVVLGTLRAQKRGAIVEHTLNVELGKEDASWYMSCWRCVRLCQTQSVSVLICVHSLHRSKDSGQGTVLPPPWDLPYAHMQLQHTWDHSCSMLWGGAIVSKLVSWCFKPSQPQRITSWLTEAFIKRYLVERTNQAEIRLEEQSEKAESCWENLWNEIQLKGP